MCAVGPYKDTVNLPLTKFNMRANSTQREPELQKFWEKSQIYEHLLKSNTGVSNPLHALSFGPLPYAALQRNVFDSLVLADRRSSHCMMDHHMLMGEQPIMLVRECLCSLCKEVLGP